MMGQICHHGHPMSTYAALVSGGVDSSLALYRMAGRPVTAYYLKIWLEDEASFLGSCPWEEDLSYAQAVCRDLRVPLEVIPLQEEYYQRVVSYTLAELRAGRTPSPDLFCNQRIKFGAFLDALARESTAGEAPRVVTGHYAATRQGADGVTRLLMAPDPVKDQTYFLSHLRQEQVRRAVFPLGTLTKREVRSEATRAGLATRDRPDSQGICFLGGIRYADFVRHYLGESEGPVIEDESGVVLGTHRGAWFYTIGQRQGLGLGNGPWYVVARDIHSNEIRVAHAAAAEEYARDTFFVGDVSAVAADPHQWPRGTGSPRLYVKLRHGPDCIPCTMERVSPPAGGAAVWQVRMIRRDRGVAPGQFAVFYTPPECLGTGRILDEREVSL